MPPAAAAQVPMALRSWLKGQYPTLALSDSWLSSTVSAFTGTRSGADTELIRFVNETLLSSDLAAVCQHGSLPSANSSGNGSADDASIIAKGPRGAVLVQITAKLDIGHSAQTQLDVLEARKAARTTVAGRAALASSDAEAGAAADAHTQAQSDHMAEFNASEEAASLPATVFPRSMLQLKLSDGFTTFTAFEHRRIPALSMGDTPLGAKLLLRDVKMQKEQLFLAPGSVIYKGGRVEALDKDAEDRLIDQLRAKLGKPPLRATARARTQAPAVQTPVNASAAGTEADIALDDDDAFAEEEAILAELEQQRVSRAANSSGPSRQGGGGATHSQRDGNTSRFFNSAARRTHNRTHAQAQGAAAHTRTDESFSDADGNGDGIGSSFLMDLDEEERALTGTRGGGTGQTAGNTTAVAQEGFIILERNDSHNPIVLSDSE